MPQAGTQHGGQYGIDEQGIQFLKRYFFALKDLFHDKPTYTESYNPQEVVVFDLKKANMK